MNRLRLYDNRLDRIKKKNCNSLIVVSIFCDRYLNVDSKFKNYQLEIVYLDKIFLEVREIFLDTVFLLIIPDLATCIRID